MGIRAHYHLNAPFREGTTFNDEQIRKVVVLMTDGDNNIGSSYSAYGPWATLRLTDKFGSKIINNVPKYES